MIGGGFGLPLFYIKGGVMPKKVDDIVTALRRENPKWPDGKIYAIANATYNKMKKRG
jgi:hypothetical protein